MYRFLFASTMLLVNAGCAGGWIAPDRQSLDAPTASDGAEHWRITLSNANASSAATAAASQAPVSIQKTSDIAVNKPVAHCATSRRASAFLPEPGCKPDE